MAIVRFDPADWHEANVLLIESDASTNKEALLDIERWAADNGFVRTNEYWLRQIFREGRRLFRGVCERVTEDVVQSNEELNRRGAEAIERMPVTPHQSD